MEIKVNKNNIRIDIYLKEKLDVSRNYVRKNIEFIKVNGKSIKPNYILNNDDIISVNIKEENFTPKPFNLEVLYEDKYFFAVLKPVNLVVYPGSGKEENSVLHQIKSYTSDLSDIYEGREGIVHRLDKDTSGVLLIAKDNETHKKLSLLFKNNKIKREYLLIASGIIKEDSGTINAPIGRDQKSKTKMTVTSVSSKKSVTHFNVVERYFDSTYVKAYLETGRTHQIRVHFKYIGHPIINDHVYNNEKVDDYILLHSSKLEFDHPYTKDRIIIESRIPKRIKDKLNILEKEE